MTRNTSQHEAIWAKAWAVWLLLASLLLPYAQAALMPATGLDATLPICCRTHGQHKCIMRMSAQLRAQLRAESAQSPTLEPQAEARCPYVLGAPVSSIEHMALPASQSVVHHPPFFTEQASSPRSGNTQLHTQANPKRGPPAEFSILL